MSKITKASIVKGVVNGKFDRFTVKAGEDLVTGNVVYVSAEGAIPTVKKAYDESHKLAGVIVEDVANGKLGVCIRANTIVSVIANDTIAQGEFVQAGGTGATAGRVVPFAAGVTAAQYVLGQAIIAGTTGNPIDVALNIHIVYP